MGIHMFFWYYVMVTTTWMRSRNFCLHSSASFAQATPNPTASCVHMMHDPSMCEAKETDALEKYWIDGLSESRKLINQKANIQERK